MNIWIALLRGINVAGRHIIPMKDLSRLMEANGFKDVRTYIQSGNVVFRSPSQPGDEIGKLIEEKFGFQPQIFYLSVSDFKKAIANNPYKTDQGKSVHFFFCDKEPASLNYDLLESLKAKSEEYKLVGKVFYLYAPDGIGRSKLVEKMGKAFTNITITARNLNTINKLEEMITEVDINNT